MARTKKTLTKGGPRPQPAVIFLMYQLQQLAPQLAAAAAVRDVAKLEQLLLSAASGITNWRTDSEMEPPSFIKLASMSPVPAAVECLAAAGASVLGEDTAVAAWESTPALGPAGKVFDWEAFQDQPCEKGPDAMFSEDHKQYSCLLLAARYSPSLDMVPLLVRLTLQKAKQQWQQQNQQQQQQQQAKPAPPAPAPPSPPPQQQHQPGRPQQQQAAWQDVLYTLVKGPMSCAPRRAALVLQQVVELEGIAAASGVVRRLLEEYSQLRQNSSEEEDIAVDALTHLAQVLLLMWLGGCGEVEKQRGELVNPLQQACGVVPPQGQQGAVQQAQEAAQVAMPASWDPIHTALGAVVAATVAAAEPGAADGDGSTEEVLEAIQHQQEQEEELHRLKMYLQQLAVEQADFVGAPPLMATGDLELMDFLQAQADATIWAAAGVLGDLLSSCIAEGQHALVEAAAADLCRQLLAAWLASWQQLQQEWVEAVVRAARVMVAAGKHT